MGSLLLIPIIASVSGASGWASAALGQSLGAAAATILQYGWGFMGPTMLVGLDAEQRARLLWVGILSRLVVACALVPVAVTAAVLLAPAGRENLAALTAVAGGVFGLSSLWFFVGTGRPGLAARYETIPRVGALLMAAVVVLLTRNVMWYPVVFLVGQTAAVVTLTARLASVSFSRATWAAAFQALKDQRAAAATDVIVAVAQSLPVSILAGVAPAALPPFAAGDRVQKLGQSGIQPLFNAFQGWVSEGAHAEQRIRMRTAVRITFLCGATAGLAVAAGLPLFGHVLFAGKISVGYAVSVPTGLTLALYSLSSAVNFNVLAPAARAGSILRSTAAAALVVTAGMFTLPPLLGAAGGALSMAASQLAAVCVQWRTWRRITAPVSPGSLVVPTAQASAPHMLTT
jgi:hypothetical protein